MKKLILIMLQLAFVVIFSCTACTHPKDDNIQQQDDVFQISAPFNETKISSEFLLIPDNTIVPDMVYRVETLTSSHLVLQDQISILDVFNTKQSFESDDPYYTSQPETEEIEVHEIVKSKVINADLFASSTSNDVKQEVREAASNRLVSESAKRLSKQSNQIVSTEIVETIDMSLYSPMLIANIQSSGWTGEPLSKSKGAIMGPSGKETYYNLPMEGVVRRMYQMGFEGEYWVRADGAKMLGPYIMVAANLQIRPKGTLVETSLGTGIVADTGTFALYNPTQLDIAVAW